MAAMLRSVAAAASASFPFSDNNSNKLSTFSVSNLPVVRSERSSITIHGTARNGKLIPKAVAAENSFSAPSKSG